MRFLVAFLALTTVARAAIVQGVVLESESGHAFGANQRLAHTGAGGQRKGDVHTHRIERNVFYYGAPGSLLTLQREGFATFRYGATCGTCPGAPLFLVGDEKTALDIRMNRLGAITGSVVDENLVGMPGIPIGFIRQPVR